MTPEFPGGTWAYFLCIAAEGTPAFPYQVARSYYGSPTGGAATSITEPVATSFVGGPQTLDRAGGVSGTLGTGPVTLTWNGVEGGIYTIEASNTLAGWSSIATNVVVTGGAIGGIVETGPALSTDRRFYRTVRPGVSAYDSTGFAGTTGGGNPTSVAPGGSAARGTAVDVTITFSGNVPVNVQPVTATLAVSISGINTSRPATNQVKATFAIPAGAATGAQTIVVAFPGPTFTLTGAFTIL